MTDTRLPDGLTIDLSIEAGDWGPLEPLKKLCERAVAETLASGLFVVPHSELSVVLTDDASIKVLNNNWRQKDKPTNVLSFPGSDPDDERYGPLLGDIVVALETVTREADEMGIEFPAHLTHLFVHGLLHLFDYDHQDLEEAEVMERKERQIMRCLGYEDPYEGRPLLLEDD
ncbi:putative metalloprotease [Roseibium sp. TrichSKD4]|uniref:rRNA maturation RNase YbeY n=1 Tax=Roseibium sp. TrichSKD4 TaxID=744980 RepID=UPI0001E56621|nr:rRNA maturation RNase YbeY [Roseibium sp. TrichSKD4]EFO32749.1 putative metalloprotease [Roseibium sp. TrichSKD4]